MPPKKSTSAKKKKASRSKAASNRPEQSPTPFAVIPPPRDDVTPSHGWAVELQESLARNKKQPCSKNRLAIAKAACVLRQWKVCQKAAEAGLTKGGASDTETTQFEDYLMTARAELGVKSYVDRDKFKREFAPAVFNEDRSLDTGLMYSGNPIFTNLNWIQFAAMAGDIRLLETIVSWGAALDYPVPSDCPHATTPHVPAPVGSTALALTMATVATTAKMAPILASYPPQTLEQVKRSLHCSIILIMLGADVNKKVEFPAPLHSMEPATAYHGAGVNGLTVKELAVMSKDKEILEAIRLMEELPAERAWCRCGSRLPWKDCHASPLVPGQHAHYIEDKKGDQKVICYRHSPFALCPCKLSKKHHFDCCGWFSSRPTYQNDFNGELISNVIISSNSAGGSEMIDGITELLSRHAATGSTPDAPMFPGTNDEYKAGTVQMFKTMGMSMITSMIGPKTRMNSWDPNVYAGVIERIDRWFTWTDVHWKVEEPELLQRVKEWNDALEVYCNDMGLTGPARERVVRQHTASPLGPCGNSKCNEWETSVKEFNRCARCKAIAYCSRECQKGHWKAHKKECIVIGTPAHV